jgi:SAM-dependent methyltransferase
MPIADYHEEFAAVYDTFYSARDVVGEARFATDLLELDGGRGKDVHILDLGCGTGSHVLAFAEAGIAATGFDISPAMITRARAKRPTADSAPVRFETGTFTDFCRRLDGTRFDGAVSFFNVLNCMVTPGAMLEHLRLLHSRLADGARCLIEVWNGAAVFVDEPHPDVRHYSVDNEPSREMVRITMPELDRINQICMLRYRVLTLDRATAGFTEFESVHTLRFLTPVQYRHLFELADLAVVDEFPKGRLGTPINDHDWYISYLVRRDSP